MYNIFTPARTFREFNTSVAYYPELQNSIEFCKISIPVLGTTVSSPMPAVRVFLRHNNRDLRA